MRPRRAIAVGACLVVLGAGVARAQGGGGSAGGTSFSQDGTITVNIDLLVGGISGEIEPIDPQWQTDADAIAQQIEDYWNEGFASHPFGDCGLPLRLDVDIDAVDVDAMSLVPRTDDYVAMATNPGRHTIGWSEGSGSFSDGSNAAWPEIYDPYDLNEDAGHDSTSPWQHDLDGWWSPHLETPRDFAHEVGHLMGLGDDYHDATQETAAGREGTLMGDGDMIDQALVDRLAEAMRRAGIDLPRCETWSGTARLAFDGNVAGEATFPCHGTAEFRFEVRVAQDGTATGSGSIHGAPYLCETDVGPVPGPDPSGPFTISGTKGDASFELIFLPGSATACCAAWPSTDPSPLFTVPIVAPDRAEAKISTSASYGQPWSGALTLSVTMTCTSCEAATSG